MLRVKVETPFIWFMSRPGSRVKVFLSFRYQMQFMSPASYRDFSLCHDDFRAVAPYHPVDLGDL